MQGPSADDPEAGQTVELTLGDLRRELESSGDRRRDQLPGLEPDRRITDWGRSERVEGLVDRTVYDFLYHYWFRVDVEGIENVPLEGGALLVANHAGAIPPDGAMIAKAIREEHPRARSVHLLTDPRFSAIPGVGMLMTKIGGVAGHPDNLHRLLFDERQLVLAFPEGSGGTRKPLKERYRVRRFDSGASVAGALRAGVPIVPVAVLGSEEAVPVWTRLGAPFGRLLPGGGRLRRLPVALPLPLPAKIRLRFLEPVTTDQLGEDRASDPVFAQALAHDIRALIQENLLELVAGRRSVWLG